MWYIYEKPDFVGPAWINNIEGLCCTLTRTEHEQESFDWVTNLQEFQEWPDEMKSANAGSEHDIGWQSVVQRNVKVKGNNIVKTKDHIICFACPMNLVK